MPTYDLFSSKSVTLLINMLLYEYVHTPLVGICFTYVILHWRLCGAAHVFSHIRWLLSVISLSVSVLTSVNDTCN